VRWGAILIAIALISPAQSLAEVPAIYGDSGSSQKVRKCLGAPFTVKFAVGLDGYVRGPIDTGGRDPQTDIEARREADAIHRVEPYAPRYRGLNFTLQFRPKRACAESEPK